MILDLSALPSRLNIRADTDPPVVGSMVFALNNLSNFRTENVAPYAVAGDRNGDYFQLSVSRGSYFLTAHPFSLPNAGGTVGNGLSVSFNVVDPRGLPNFAFVPPSLSFILSPGDATHFEITAEAGVLPTSPVATSLADNATRVAPSWLSTTSAINAGTLYPLSVDASALGLGSYSARLYGSVLGYADGVLNVALRVTEPNQVPFIGGFTLVDADTNADIISITDGLSLSLASLPPNLNIRANTINSAVKSVGFSFSGQPFSNVESVAPFALAGDVNGNYNPWRHVSEGYYQLVATPFTQTAGRGFIGVAHRVTFQFTP
ncbi:MAG: hypothetical protein ACO1RT_14425 [Planctomycetaceae bacterium]